MCWTQAQLLKPAVSVILMKESMDVAVKTGLYVWLLSLISKVDNSVVLRLPAVSFKLTKTCSYHFAIMLMGHFDCSFNSTQCVDNRVHYRSAVRSVSCFRRCVSFQVAWKLFILVSQMVHQHQHGLTAQLQHFAQFHIEAKDGTFGVRPGRYGIFWPDADTNNGS